MSDFEPVQCGDREHRSLDGLECFQCPDYTRAVNKNTDCKADKCEIYQILRVDGTCESCPTGKRANFMQRACTDVIDPASCSDNQIFIEVMNMCDQCPEYSRPQGDHCAADQCTTN